MGLEVNGVKSLELKMEKRADQAIPMDLTLSLPSTTLENLGLGDNVLTGLSDLHLEATANNASGAAGDQSLLMLAQALMRKNELYQNIDELLQRTYVFQPNVFNNLMMTSEDEDQVTSLHRDRAVGNLRFLNIFYGYSPSTFALAVNILDRLLGKVTAQPKYLSCIATCCFYIAVRTVEYNVFIPTPAELIKLSQCGGTAADLARMERLILDKVQWELNAITPLTFLQLFFELLVKGNVTKKGQDPAVLNSLVAKLEVLMCQFEFTKFRAETLALGLVSQWLQEEGLLSSMKNISPVLELQYYCQICDGEFSECRSLVLDYLAVYGNQPSKLPRLQLQWTVSRRTLTKLKPSTRCILDLEPIMEDETDSDNDAGPFDSENDDSELQRALHKKFNDSLAAAANAAADQKYSCADQKYSCADQKYSCSHCPLPPGRAVVLDLNQNNPLLPSSVGTQGLAPTAQE